MSGCKLIREPGIIPSAVDPRSWPQQDVAHPHRLRSPWLLRLYCLCAPRNCHVFLGAHRQYIGSTSPANSSLGGSVRKPSPPSRCVTPWVNPITPHPGPSAERGTEASALRARSRAATSYNCRRLKDFHKWTRPRKGLRGTTPLSDTDRVQVWAVEVGATTGGSGGFLNVSH
jgi:hypothetical protein